MDQGQASGSLVAHTQLLSRAGGLDNSNVLCGGVQVSVKRLTKNQDGRLGVAQEQRHLQACG